MAEFEPRHLQDSPGKPAGGVFTPKEREILSLVAQGLTVLEIAQALEIKRQTVKNHLADTRRRGRIPTTTGVVVRAMQLGEITILGLTPLEEEQSTSEGR